jgi:two-component system nitrate/nitrite response regulator NarL
MTNSYKIIIVDRNILFREGLSILLQREPEIRVIGEANSIAEALEILQGETAHLLLLDGELLGPDDQMNVRDLHRIYPELHIVVMSTFETEELLIPAVRSGARGMLYKNHSMTRFMNAIHALQRGEAVIPRAMVGRLLDELERLSSPAGEGLNALTPREVEVLRELGRGLSNREIAQFLDIAENTVKVHVHNILDKLNLRNRRQAARFARVHGIAPSTPYHAHVHGSAH